MCTIFPLRSETGPESFDYQVKLLLCGCDLKKRRRESIKKGESCSGGGRRGGEERGGVRDSILRCYIISLLCTFFIGRRGGVRVSSSNIF